MIVILLKGPLQLPRAEQFGGTGAEFAEAFCQSCWENGQLRVTD